MPCKRNGLGDIPGSRIESPTPESSTPSIPRVKGGMAQNPLPLTLVLTPTSTPYPRSPTPTQVYRSLLALCPSTLGPGWCTEDELAQRLTLYQMLEEALSTARAQGYEEGHRAGHQTGYVRGTKAATRARVPISPRPLPQNPRRVARAIARGIARGEILPFKLPAHLDPDDPLFTVGTTPDAADVPELYTEDLAED